MKTSNLYLSIFLAICLTFFTMLSLAVAAVTSNEFGDEYLEENTELYPVMTSGCDALPTNNIILGWTSHGSNSAYYHDNHGVSDEAILQAVTTTPIWNSNNQSWNYIGNYATVCLNSYGYVTTCWATSSLGYRY